MAWDGSGNVNRTNGTNGGTTTWQLDAAAGTEILASRHDVHDQDLADSIENCVARDGQNTPTANLPMGGYRHTNVGDASLRTHYAKVSQVQDAAYTYAGTAGGTANAITLSLTPAPTALTAGMMITFKVNADNTSTVTLNLNALGAVEIKKSDAPSTALMALEKNDLVQYQIAVVIYDGSNWVLINPYQSGILSWTPTFTPGGSMTYSSVTLNNAHYNRQGKIIHFNISVTGTTGGTASNTISFTVPTSAQVSTIQIGGGAAGFIFDGSGTYRGGIWRFITQSTIEVSKYDQSNFGLGADRGFQINGWYEAA